jgi:hypothetical protein
MTDQLDLLSLLYYDRAARSSVSIILCQTRYIYCLYYIMTDQLNLLSLSLYYIMTDQLDILTLLYYDRPARSTVSIIF